MPLARKNGSIIRDMPWDFALLLAVLGIAVPLLGRRRVRQLMQFPATTKADRLSIYASTIIFQWVMLAVVAWRTSARRVSPSDLGLSLGSLPLVVVTALLLCAVVFVNQVFSVRRVFSQPSQNRGPLSQLAAKLFPQDAVERLCFFGLVCTVAVCEEFIYRGFAQYAGQSLGSNSIVVGILFSSLLFALAHVYQGRRGLVSTFAVGLIFAAVRSWTESLIPTVSAHFVADLTVGFLAPSRLKAAAGVETKGPDSSVEKVRDRP